MEPQEGEVIDIEVRRHARARAAALSALLRIAIDCDTSAAEALAHEVEAIEARACTGGAMRSVRIVSTGRGGLHVVDGDGYTIGYICGPLRGLPGGRWIWMVYTSRGRRATGRETSEEAARARALCAAACVA